MSSARVYTIPGRRRARIIKPTDGPRGWVIDLHMRWALF